MSKAVKKAISLPADLAAELEAIARDENKSLSAVVVTGDRAMLNLKKYHEIRIVSLRQFLDEISSPNS